MAKAVLPPKGTVKKITSNKVYATIHKVDKNDTSNKIIAPKHVVKKETPANKNPKAAALMKNAKNAINKKK
ncbi:MAG: hypothetical protein FWD40_00785 [Treponema sp.]|nr:hypothetical protein [Treponema sp.]